jgi:hypothetical protein
VSILENQIKIIKINVSSPNFLEGYAPVWEQLIGLEPLKFRFFKAITGWIARTGNPAKPPDRIS